MKERTVQQIKVIESTNPATFQEQVNEALKQLPTVINVTYPESKGLCALIRYNETIEESETAEDEYKLKTGRSYICMDCPDLALDPDRRAVSHYCRYKKDRTGLKMPACEDFYIRLIRGETHIVTPEERQEQFDDMDRADRERRKNNTRLVQEISRQKKLQYKMDREAAAGSCRYLMEWIYGKWPNKDCERLEGKLVTAAEIPLLLGKGTSEWSENKIIKFAQDNGAAELRRCTLEGDSIRLWPPGEEE